MDMEKDKDRFLLQLADDLSFEELQDLCYSNDANQFYSARLADWFVDKINYGWRLWQAAKAQAVPESNALLSAAMDAVQKLGSGDFVLVPKEPTDKTIAHMTNTPVEVNLLCDHADTFLSEGEACIAYQAMIEAQEQSHD